MALNTYSALQTAIAGFLNRGDLTSVIPDFITLAESQLNSRLMAAGGVRQMQGKATPTVSSDTTALPADFLGVRSLYMPLTTQPRIQFALPEKLDEQKMVRPSQDGDPQLFTVDGSNFEVWPFNGGSFASVLRYWQSLPPLASNSSNWLLLAKPDLYLYTALIQSAPYLKDDDRVTVWGTIAGTAFDDFITADRMARQAPQESAPILPFDPP